MGGSRMHVAHSDLRALLTSCDWELLGLGTENGQEFHGLAWLGSATAQIPNVFQIFCYIDKTLYTQYHIR
jgi:hypothetical protein